MGIAENEIAFFRYRNRLMAGACLSSRGGKARFATAPKETVITPVENVLLRTGETAGGWKGAVEWMSRAEAGSEGIDLEVAWELVRDDADVWTAQGLADLYFGKNVTTEQLAALLFRLERDLYFEAERRGGGYRALSDEEVHARRAAAAREAARIEEMARFQHWFYESGKASPESVGRWVSRLKDYVLNREKSVRTGWVERMAGARVDPRIVFNRLVRDGVWGPDEHLDLIRAEAPVAFPAAVIDAADGLRLAPLLDDRRRRDLTDLPVYAIDDAATTDMDDGVSVLTRADGTRHVGVHITDVAGLVPLDSETDREAASRVSSLYFPDRKIPMFPEALSSDLGSLRPGEPRLALSQLFEVSAEGTVESVDIVPSVIRCREKLSYEAVDGILEDPSHSLHGDLSALHAVAEWHCMERLHNGAIDVEHPNRRIGITADGEIEFSLQDGRSPANLLVSEMMVMANVATARYCLDRNIPVVYRTQAAPDLAEFSDVENEVLRRYRVLRRMRRASMSLTPDRHGGLGVAAYCQATSPLRRYTDLAVQRQVAAFLLDRPLPYDNERIQRVVFEAEERVRSLIRIERQRERYWLLRYLQGRIGDVFEAVALEARDRTMRVEVLEIAFQTDIRPPVNVSPGDSVSVRLGRCDPWLGDIAFSPA
ncbi:MAG: RNB domain-containing ribonuclease [Gemmatimonadota bacterium]|nr:RNB domain-containing ribonuclease [Gemmatimonadota bacterium]